MSTTLIAKTAIPAGLDATVLARILEEGYGPGAWHGADLNAAVADVAPELAFWRPAPGRHNIAEIALHHAYCARSVRSQLAGTPPEAFVVAGDDWFPLPGDSGLSWDEVRAALDAEQSRLAAVVAGFGTAGSSRQQRQQRQLVTDPDRFDLVLGITCHAIYHAGQIQLIKRLRAG